MSTPHLDLTTTLAVCSTYNDHRMQEQYHPGHYKKDRWSCCVNDDKNNIGCRQAYRYSDPQPLGASSSTALSKF